MFQGMPVPGSRVCTQTITDENGNKIKITCCNGERTEMRNVQEIPPLLVLNVAHIVRQGKLTSDIQKFPMNLLLTSYTNGHPVETEYTLVGATFHRPDHFTGASFTRSYGWLYYDALNRRLHEYSGREDGELNHIVYVRNVSK
ncbi:uncharacterized protein LOC135156817 [Lytechinus pictus]|uniref:uncharacterized protein LOC135156817 n=1 Tax=Lytechinus pictus TaxID=7653 RepID=UPI0030BA1BCA